MGPVIPPEPRRTSTRQAAEKARMFLSQMVEEENEEKQEEIGSPGEDFEGSTEIEDENELDEEFPFDEDENAEAEVAKDPIKGKENDKMPQGGEGSVIPTELNADNTSAKTDSAVDVDPEEAQRDTIGSDVNIPVASDTIPEHNTGGVREEEGSNNEPVGCSVADSTYSGSKPKRLTQLAECEQGLTKPSIEQVFGKPLEQAAFKAQSQCKGLTKTGKRRGRPPKKTKELLSPVVKTAFEGGTETVLTTETEAKSEGNVSTSTDHLSTTTTSQKGETKQTDSLAVKPKVQGKKTGKRGRKPGGARGNVNPSGKKASVASALQETVASRPGDGLSVADPAPVQSEMITTTKGSQGLDDESSSLKQDDNQSTPPIRIENVRTLPTHATGDSVTEMDNIIKILRTPKQKKSEVSIGRGFSRVKALFTVDPQEQPPPESGDALSEEERIVCKETHEFSQTVPKATLPKTIVFEKPFSHTESSKEVFFPLTKEEFFPIPSSHHLGLARRPQQTVKAASMPHTDQMTTHKKGPMQTIGKPQQEKQRRLKDWTQTTTGPILQTKQKPHLHTSKHPSSPVAIQSPKTFMDSPQLVTQKPLSHKRPSQKVYQPPSMTMSRPELLGSASNTHSTTGPPMVQRPGLHVPAKNLAKLSTTPNPPPASAYPVNPKSQVGAIVPSKEMLRSPNSAFTALKKSNPVVDQHSESTRIDLTGDGTSTVVSVAQTAQVNKPVVFSGSASQTIPRTKKSDVTGQGAKTTPVNERGPPNVAPSSTVAPSASQDKGMAAHLRKEMATFRMTISGHVRAEVNENPSSLVKVLALYRGLSSQSKEKVLLTDNEISSLAEIKTDVFSTPTAFLECVIRQIAVHFPSCVKSCSDHMTLLWGDIELVQEDEREYLLYTGKSSKSPAVLATYIPPRARDRKAYPKPDSPGQCPVTIYKQYLQMRRPESNIPEAPFYLMPTRDFSDAFQTRGLEDKSFSLLAALILGKAKKALNPENVVEILD